MTPQEIAALQARAAQADQFEASVKTERELREKAEAEAKANAEKVKAFEAAATKAAGEKRDAEIKKLFEDCAAKLTEESAKPYRAMDEDTFSAISEQMRETAKKRAADDPALFGEQARNGAGEAGGTAEDIQQKAAALIHQYAQKGQTLDVVDAVRMVSRKAAA